jgi:RNA polymerase sigma-70 factor (ECF subfamily)
LLANRDREIALRLQQRDATAMAELYDTYGRLIYSVIFRAVSNQATAEDLVQETFFRIWNRIHTFDLERGRLEGWIVTIARNRAIDYIRSLRSRPNEVLTSLEDLEHSGWFITAENEADHLTRRKAVGDALNLLNESQREVLELTHFQGLTQTEIAERTSKPLGTVKSLVRSALKVLRTTQINIQISANSTPSVRSTQTSAKSLSSIWPLAASIVAQACGKPLS